MNKYKPNNYIKTAISQRHISQIKNLKAIKLKTLYKYHQKNCYTFFIKKGYFLKIKGKMLKT